MSADLAEMERLFNEAEKEVRKRREALEAARDASAEERRGPLKDLTERAHRILCGWNHTDGCSWGYEEASSDRWRCDTHMRWLRHVESLVLGSRERPAPVTPEQYAAILDHAEQIKAIAPQALFLLRNGKVQP